MNNENMNMIKQYLSCLDEFERIRIEYKSFYINHMNIIVFDSLLNENSSALNKKISAIDRERKKIVWKIKIKRYLEINDIKCNYAVISESMEKLLRNVISNVKELSEGFKIFKMRLYAFKKERQNNIKTNEEIICFFSDCYQCENSCICTYKNKNCN